MAERNRRRRSRKRPSLACPLYLRSLLELAGEKTTTITSERLAELAGVNAAKVRKDLSYLGSYGTRGVGYDVEYLLFQMSRALGLTQDWPVVIVGIGNLGHALANYGGFADRGFPVVALVDADLRTVGEVINGSAGASPRRPARGRRRARHRDRHHRHTGEPPPRTSPTALIAAGVSSILNFAPTVISVPEDVSLRKVDLAVELQILSFYQQRQAGTDGLASVGRRRRGDRRVAASGSADAGR